MFHSSRSRILLALTVLVVIAATALVWRARVGPSTVPSLAEYGEMDPDVRAFINGHLEEVADKPNEAGSWTRLGMASEANGFVGLAARAYGRAIDIDPSAAKSWYRLALGRARLGDQEGAAEALDRSITLDGTHAPAHWRKGRWRLDAGDLAGAQAAFERATLANPADPGGTLGTARVALAQGDNNRSAALLENLLENRPGDRYALQLLGTAYRRLGREDDARFVLAIGAQGQPIWADDWSDEVASYRRGFAATLKEATGHALDGRFERAIPLLERLSAERPHDVALQVHLGGIYVAAGRGDDALRVLEDAIARDPANFDAHLNLAGAHLLARSLHRAEAHVDRALTIRPAAASALEIKGRLLWQAGRSAEAVPVLESALSRDPRRARPRAWIGFIHLEHNRSRQAVSQFEAALRTDPMLVDALAGLAMAQARLGAVQEAAFTLRRAAQIDPAHPRVQQARALVESTSASKQATR